jgi:hypothetical protein
LERAKRTAIRGKGDFMDDLYLPDLIWANAVSAGIQVDDNRFKWFSPNLVGLVRRGLVDREPQEYRDAKEERMMKYAASMTTHLMDKVSILHEEASALRSSL